MGRTYNQKALRDQYETGWVCPECGLARGEDKVDPCLGKLPGVLFACCGHGGKTPNTGYIYFENGTCVRFGELNVEHVDKDDLQRSLDCKRRMEG